ncbi:S49 family peptidase [Ferirhizobium litorale]|uniref:S49 family peptidase n=1 Tax=Ferirhizobium litorale TaxID=2927786 RepID=A0AAE3QK59_9HYPH|nr:S49 family peptidase [Fererhizobium litorale]MDI7924588.1 S49 family peptidase [Fererhizobium litorale]
MSFAYGHIAQRLFDTPLMYDERKAEAFLHGLGGRIAGNDVVIANPVGAIDHVAFETGRPSAGKLGDRTGRLYQAAGVLPFYVIDNVAIIPIEGSLVHKGGWVGSYSGQTSYQGLQTQIAAVRQAGRAGRIKGVAFEVDSFGGEVNGGFETAAAIAELSKEMPTISILTDYAYSAGYLLASQARQIIMPEFGGAGSIGVIILHADYSRALDGAGIKVTIVRAGKKKAEGNPYEPLSEELFARWEQQAETMRGKFAEVVAKGRRGKITKARALATEADAFEAEDALKLGLADAIGDPTAAFDAFVKAVNRS